MQLATRKEPPKALVVSINREHTLAIQGREAYETHAIRCGTELIKAKKIVGHGGWLKWIKSNCEFSEQSARAYMQLVEEVADPKRQRVSDLPRTARQVEADRRATRLKILSQEPEPVYDPAQHLGVRDIPHETSDVKLYLDALRAFQTAVRESGIVAAKAGSISAEGWQYIKGQHTKVLQLLHQLEEMQK